MNKKTIIYIVSILVIVIGIVAICIFSDNDKPVNNTQNTTNSTGTSLRNQIMGATQNYVANTNTITTNTTSSNDSNGDLDIPTFLRKNKGLGNK